ncbi:UXT3, partial [Symbiodinium sp. KB8]
MLSGEQRHVAGLIAFNLAVNVSIVLVNKYVFDVFGFNYAATLTAVHFWATAAGLRLMAWQKLFTPKPVALLQVLPIAAAYALSIPLSNLSLAFNSVGVYQMIKILTTPFIAMVQFTAFGKTFSRPIIGALSIVVVGVVMATVNDFQ